MVIYNTKPVVLANCKEGFLLGTCSNMIWVGFSLVVVASLWRRFRAVGAALAGPGPTLWRTEKLRPGSPWLVIDPPGASLVGTFESRGESMSGQRFTKASSIRILVMVLSTCLITSQRTKARELPARARPKGEPSSEQITSAWASRDRSPEPHEQLLEDLFQGFLCQEVLFLLLSWPGRAARMRWKSGQRVN